MNSAVAVDLDPGTATAIAPASPELGLLGRVAIVGIAVAGALVALHSWLGIALFVPYAVVGGLLVIRRPRSLIGWILIGIAWQFALLTAPLDATVQGFAAGSVPLPLAIFAVAEGISGGLVFYLFAVLAFVFPTGRLATGRWGTASRLALGAGLLIVVATVVMPVIAVGLVGSPNNVLVQNPFAVMPDLVIWSLFSSAGGPAILFFAIMLLLLAGAISLVVRARRAVGIERQQMRWFTASIAGVVTAVIFGMVAAAIEPILSDNGVAWLPAMAAFALVPVAIGIAVMRYRLYEIDTIINRAIVYGLLTAILAGIYAASIALMQRLFGTVTGQTSDAAIVLTTLVVVVAFTPIKNRLQAVVDRRFKGASDATTQLSEFVDALDRAMWRVKPTAALRHLLDVSTSAMGAAGGDVAMGSLAVAHVGTDVVTPEMVVTSGHGPGRIVLSISPRPAGPPYLERDRAAVTEAVEAVVRALATD
jgi:hypothetical protein